MNWEAISAIGEAVGAIAVIASLVYLARQIRQNTRSLQAATYHSVVTALGDLTRPLTQDPEWAAAWEASAEDWESADSDTRRRIVHFAFAAFRLFEDVHYQYQKGALEPKIWVGWKRFILGYFRSPTIQAWWPLRAPVFSSDFKQFLENSELDVETPRVKEIVESLWDRPAEERGD